VKVPAVEAGVVPVSFEKHLTRFAGLPVVDFPVSPSSPPPEVAADAVAWRVWVPVWGDSGRQVEFEERFRGSSSRSRRRGWSPW